jgi:hypothetical protein
VQAQLLQDVLQYGAVADYRLELLARTFTVEGCTGP